MGTPWRIGWLAVAFVLLGGAAPASAVAGTYTWAQPADLPLSAGASAAAGPDRYGARPWGYLEDTGSGDQALPTHASGIAGNLTGWEDTSTGAFIATDQSSSSAPLVLDPGSAQSVALAWTPPAGLAATLPIAGTLSDTASGSCVGSGLTWALQQGTSTLQSGSLTPGASPASIQASASAPGSPVRLVLAPSDAIAGQRAGCHTANLNFRLTATVPPPAPSLADPGSSSATPTFTGSASDGFGYSSTVTVDVYAGASTSGPPVLQLSAAREGTSFSVQPSSPLSPGQYTAQAVQTDAVPDSGQSAAVTFSIPGSGGATGGTGGGSSAPSSPTVVLDSPGSRPLLSGSPTLSGTAGSAAGDDQTVFVAVYAGTQATGTAVRWLAVQRGADGSFAAPVTPALPDGVYTAVAGQRSDDGPGVSQPVTFSIKAQPPALTLDAPRNGGTLASPRLVLSGRAGHGAGDGNRVTVYLYSLAATDGRRLGVITVGAHNGRWSARWPKALPLGLYTVFVLQSDDAGHTTIVSHRFLIVPAASHRLRRAPRR